MNQSTPLSNTKRADFPTPSSGRRNSVITAASVLGTGSTKYDSKNCESSCMYSTASYKQNGSHSPTLYKSLGVSPETAFDMTPASPQSLAETTDDSREMLFYSQSVEDDDEEVFAILDRRHRKSFGCEGLLGMMHGNTPGRDASCGLGSQDSLPRLPTPLFGGSRKGNCDHGNNSSQCDACFARDLCEPVSLYAKGEEDTMDHGSQAVISQLSQSCDDDESLFSIELKGESSSRSLLPMSLKTFGNPDAYTSMHSSSTNEYSWPDCNADVSNLITSSLSASTIDSRSIPAWCKL